MVADFRSAGSIGSGTGNFSGLGMPTGTADGDVVVIAFESDIEVTAPSGWEELGRFNQTAGSPTVAHAWARRVSGGITAPTITNPGWDHWIARSVAVRDVSTSGTIASNVLAATGGEATADTSVSFPTGGTPTEGNTLWMYILTMGTDQGANNTTRFTGAFSNAGLTGLAERVDNGRADGNGGVLGVWTGRRLQASNPGATTGTSADSDTKAMITLAFYTAPASELPFDTLAQNGSSSTDTTVYTTAGSMNPEPNNRMVAYILGSGTGVAAPTLSGLGLTWGLVETEEVPDASTTQKLFVYIAEGVASPTVGTVSITFGATATGCSWHFERVRGAASGTPVQKPKAATTTTPANLTLTWAAAGNAANRQLFGYAVSPQGTGNTVTPESPWLEESEIVRSTPNLKLGVWKNLSTFDTSTTVADDSTYDYCAIGLEFDLASGSTVTQASTAPAATTTGAAASDSTATQTSTAAAGQTSNSATAETAGSVASTAPAGQAAMSGSIHLDMVATSTAPAATTTTTVTAAATADQITAAPAAATAAAAAAASTASVASTAPGAAGTAVAAAETAGVLTSTPPAAVVSNTAGTTSGAVFSGAAPAATTTGSVTAEATATAVVAAPAGQIVASAGTGDIATDFTTTAAPAAFTGAVTTTAEAAQTSTAAGATVDVAAESAADTSLTSTAAAHEVTGAVSADNEATAALATAIAPAAHVGAVHVSLTVIETLTAPAAVTAHTAAAAASAVAVLNAPAAAVALSTQDVTYTPGLPYLMTTPGPPYLDPDSFGWGEGGWGEGPWGGT